MLGKVMHDYVYLIDHSRKKAAVDQRCLRPETHAPKRNAMEHPVPEVVEPLFFSHHPNTVRLLCSFRTKPANSRDLDRTHVQLVGVGLFYALCIAAGFLFWLIGHGRRAPKLGKPPIRPCLRSAASFSPSSTSM
jgi:hypothetical protein